MLTSCSEYVINREMRRFSSSVIEIPTELEVIKNRNISSANIPKGKPLFVLYLDSLECGSCRISHLIDYEPLYELSDSIGTFEVMTIFSPRQEDYDEIVKQLFIVDFSYPIYIDFSGRFRKSNACIPNDRRFHNFLIDSEKHPMFVGDPISGDIMWNLFNSAIRLL